MCYLFTDEKGLIGQLLKKNDVDNKIMKYQPLQYSTAVEFMP